MEVTTACIRLLMGVLVLLFAQVDHSYFAQKTDATFPRIVPDRLQFFEYENFSVNCGKTDASTEWRVMRKLNNIISTNSSNWKTSAPSHSIQLPYERDSGEYWCENEEGERSNAVNITVTAGSVILEIPTHPVMEGTDVILQCRNKKTQSQHIIDFYKDGAHIETLYTTNLNIQNVSKSDEGLYKCSISAAGESPQSWLNVVKQSEGNLSFEETSPRPPHIKSPDLLTLLWIVVTALLIALLLLLGLLLCRKHRVSICFSSGKSKPRSQSQEDHTVSGEYSAIDLHHATYAVVNKQRKEKESGGENAVDPDHVTYATVKKLRRKQEAEVSRAGTEPSFSDDKVIYSLVTF